MKAHFGPELFRFLKDLEANNDRDWFKKNRDRYEREVREPLTQFVLDFGPPLGKISRAITADPRPVGGSVFRIHRDTRFSKDKNPYKTHAAAHFRHVRAKDVHTPGFYLHLEPGNVFFGAGIWRPDGPSTLRIREAIVEDPERWKRIIGAKKFRATLNLAGDTLKRPPRGFDPEHPLVEDLKRKDFTVLAQLTQKQAVSADFLDRYVANCRAAAPFLRYLTDALDLEW